MTALHPEPGDLIEDYEILERIGGNMGMVFKARHRLLDKIVVLKLVPTEVITDPASLARFQREVRVMGKLEHPNLVTAADARSVGDWHLVAMEWIDGIDLQQLIRAQGPLPVAAACEVARQAAQGLQYAHQHGLIHRDIKPSNLMLTRAGILKVIDMGLALIREDSAAQLTKTGLVLGTMSYCAPEQFRDPSHVDIRVDIYSLGCTLYHLLAGKPPYSERKSFAEVVEAHLHAPFPSLAGAQPDAPAELDTVLARMTAKDRDARFSTPGEVVEALEPFARGAELGPLVPERTPQAPTARIKDGKLTPKPEGQRGAAGGQAQPKARWTRRAALLGLGGAIMGGAALWYFKRDPVVVLMDTTALDGRYDKDNVEDGGSNAVEVDKVLRAQNFLPAHSIHTAPVSDGWAGEAHIIGLRPDLVIIHRSSFWHAVNALLQLGKPPFDKKDEKTNKLDEAKWRSAYGLADDKLILFMGIVAADVRQTDFLVYSRGTDKRWLEESFRKEWVKSIESRIPWLKDRIHTMLVRGGYDGGTFRDSVTANDLRKHVKHILDLPD